MPRYKLSPEERAAEKERKDNLRNIMKGLDFMKIGRASCRERV